MIARLKKLGALYLTVFALVCAATVGFTLGTMNSNRMATKSISALEKSTRAAVLRRYGQ